LFRYRERVIDLDAKVTDRALNLRMAQQELDGAKVSGAPVDQGSFRPSQ
jgi:hypothetical protein